MPRSEMLKALTRLSLPLCAMPGLRRSAAVLFTTTTLSACASSPLVVSTPSACSTLVPDAWRSGVAAAPLPDGNTVADWVTFGDAQTAQLDKANGREADTLDIIARCEARDRAALKKVTK